MPAGGGDGKARLWCACFPGCSHGQGKQKSDTKLIVKSGACVVPQEGFEPPTPSLRMMVWVTPLIFEYLALDHGHNLHRDLRRHIMPCAVGLSQGADDFGLSFRGYGPIAAQRCQHAVMANVLAKCLHLFKVELQLVGKLSDRVTDRVRPDIGQVHSRKSSSENLTDRGGVSPMLSREATDGEAAMFVRSNRRLG
jgi:hypothetical protein